MLLSEIKELSAFSLLLIEGLPETIPIYLKMQAVGRGFNVGYVGELDPADHELKFNFHFGRCGLMPGNIEVIEVSLDDVANVKDPT